MSHMYAQVSAHAQGCAYAQERPKKALTAYLWLT